MSSNAPFERRKKYMSKSCYLPQADIETNITPPSDWLEQLVQRLHDVAAPEDKTVEQMLAEYKQHISPTSTSKQFKSIEEQLITIYQFITARNPKNLTAMALKLTEQLGACSDGFAVRVYEVVSALQTPQNMEEFLYRIRLNLVSDVGREYDQQHANVHAYNWVFLQAINIGLEVKLPNSTDPHHNGNEEYMRLILKNKFDNEFLPIKLPERITNDIRAYFAEFLDYRGEIRTEYDLAIYEKWIAYLKLVIPHLSMDDLFKYEEMNEFGGGKVIDINWDTIRNGVLRTLVRDHFIQLKKNERNALTWLLDSTLPFGPSTSNQPVINLQCLFAPNGYITDVSELFALLECILPCEHVKKSFLIQQYCQKAPDNWKVVYNHLVSSALRANRSRQKEVIRILLDYMLKVKYPLDQMTSVIQDFIVFNPEAEDELQSKLADYFRASTTTTLGQMIAWQQLDDHIDDELIKIKSRRIIKNALQAAQIDLNVSSTQITPPFLQSFMTMIHAEPLYDTVYKQIINAASPITEAIAQQEVLLSLVSYLAPAQQGTLLNLKNEQGRNFFSINLSDSNAFSPYVGALLQLPESLQEEIISNIDTQGLTPLMQVVITNPQYVQPLLTILCSPFVSAQNRFLVLSQEHQSRTPLLYSLEHQPEVSQAILDTILILSKNEQSQLFSKQEVRHFMAAPFSLFGALSSVIKTLSHETMMEILNGRVRHMNDFITIITSTNDTLIRVAWLKACFQSLYCGSKPISLVESLLNHTPTINGLDNAIINWLKEDTSTYDAVINAINEVTTRSTTLTYAFIEKNKMALRWIALLPSNLKVLYFRQSPLESKLEVNYLGSHFTCEFFEAYLSVLYSLNPEHRFPLLCEPMDEIGRSLFNLLILVSKINPTIILNPLLTEGLSGLSAEQIHTLFCNFQGDLDTHNSALYMLMRHQTASDLLRLLAESPSLINIYKLHLMMKLNSDEIANKLTAYFDTLGLNQEVNEKNINDHQDILKVLLLLPDDLILKYFKSTLGPQGFIHSCINNASCTELLIQYFKAFSKLPKKQQCNFTKTTFDADGNNLLMMVQLKASPLLDNKRTARIIYSLMSVNNKLTQQPNSAGESYLSINYTRDLKKVSGVALIKKISKLNPQVIKGMIERDVELQQKLQPLLNSELFFNDEIGFDIIEQVIPMLPDPLKIGYCQRVIADKTLLVDRLQSTLKTLSSLEPSIRFEIISQPVDEQGNHLLMYLFENELLSQEDLIELIKDFDAISMQALERQSSQEFCEILTLTQCLLIIRRLNSVERGNPDWVGRVLDILESASTQPQAVQEKLRLQLAITETPLHSMMSFFIDRVHLVAHRDRFFKVLPLLPDTLKMEFCRKGIAFCRLFKNKLFYEAISTLDPLQRTDLLLTPCDGYGNNTILKLDNMENDNEFIDVLLKGLSANQQAAILTYPNNNGDFYALRRYNVPIIEEADIEYRARYRMAIRYHSNDRGKTVVTKLNLDGLDFSDEQRWFASQLQTIHEKIQRTKGDKQYQLIRVYKNMAGPFFQWCGNKINKQDLIREWKNELSTAKNHPEIKAHRGAKDFFCKLLALLSVGGAIYLGIKNQGFFSVPVTATASVKLLTKIEEEVSNLPQQNK